MTHTIMPCFDHSQYGEDFVLYPEFGTYDNGRLAIQLFAQGKGRFATVTVNVPEAPAPDENQAWIKGYAENHEVVCRLIEVGWLTRTGLLFQTGFATVELMDLAGPLLEAWEKFKVYNFRA